MIPLKIAYVLYDAAKGEMVLRGGLNKTNTRVGTLNIAAIGFLIVGITEDCTW